MGCAVVNTWRKTPPAVQQKARPSPTLLAVVFFIGVIRLDKEKKCSTQLEDCHLRSQVIFNEFGWYSVFGLMIFENATGIFPQRDWRVDALLDPQGEAARWRINLRIFALQIRLHRIVFGFGFLLVAAYLVYHYRASIMIPAWMRQNDKELD